MRDCINVIESCFSDRQEALREGPQGGKLYHGTDVDLAARILDQNKIAALTDQKIRVNREWETIYGVSLTRSFRFAVDWRRAGAIFVLDSDKLRHRYKIIPFDYYNDRREHEEFLVGLIEPLSRYLIGILMTPETAEFCQKEDDKMIEGHENYKQLLEHPLLQIIAFPPSVPYYNPRQPKNKPL